MRIVRCWKNSLRVLWNTNRRSLLLVVCLSFLIISIPTSAHAGVLDFLDKAAKEIGVVIATALTSAIAIVPALIFFVVTGIVSWFINIVFSIPIVPGSAAGNPPIFVTQGFELLRGLANMFFLLILVFIGLATILRLREYELQKTLPRLIIAALLVNFSTVLVGFVVDIANLFGNYFLSSVGGFNLNVFTSLYQTNDFTSNLIDNPAGDFITTIVAGLVYGIVTAVFYLIATLVFLAVLIIFFLRTIILWLLVILSPLAFASAVLPATRGLIWNRWWSSLLQWSFVVIPISFFLWLSLSVMTLDSQGLFGTKSAPATDLTDNPEGVSGAIAQFLALAMGPTVGIVILLLGLTVSLSMAPSSVRGVANFAKKVGTIGAGVAGGILVAQTISRAAQSKKVQQRIEGWSDSKNSRLGANASKWNPFGYAQRAAAAAAGFGARATGGVAEKAILQSEAKRGRNAETKAKGQNVVENVHDLRQARSDTERAGIWKAMATQKQLKDAADPDVLKENVLTPKEILQGMKASYRRRDADLVDATNRAYGGTPIKDARGEQEDYLDENGNQEIDYGEPDEQGRVQRVIRKKVLADEFRVLEDQATKDAHDPNDRTRGGFTKGDVDKGLLTEKEFENKSASYLKKIIAEATGAEEIKQLPKRFWQSPEAIDAIHNFWTGNQMQQAAVHFGRDFMNAIEQSKDARLERDPNYYFEPVARGRRGPEGAEYTVYQPRNPALARQFASTPSQALGFSPVPDAETTNQLKDKTKMARDQARRLTDEARMQAGTGPATGPGATGPQGTPNWPPPQQPPPTSQGGTPQGRANFPPQQQTQRTQRRGAPRANWPPPQNP